ncbi:hypothetical protein [Methylobacillus sp. Pita1]|uniref:hypothetical protein n=1 Tax=Methylobacillus sp. Pita1 TaxID=3382642 RepID=UPI0038B5DD7F
MIQRLRWMVAICCLVASQAWAATPKALTAQVERLAALLSDGFAVGYPGATQTQVLSRHGQETTTLAVFTVEGFGGGNNFRQYLAAFSSDEAADKPYYSLLDVIPIGAGGWRSIVGLQAKVTGRAKQGGVLFTMPIMENLSDDAVNFPSKKASIRLLLENGRLRELK